MIPTRERAPAAARRELAACCSTPATTLVVDGDCRLGSITLADNAEVGFAGLKPPPTVKGVAVTVTSFRSTKWLPFRSAQGYSAYPADVLALLKTMIPVSSCPE